MGRAEHLKDALRGAPTPGRNPGKIGKKQQSERSSWPATEWPPRNRTSRTREDAEMEGGAKEAFEG